MRKLRTLFILWMANRAVVRAWYRWRETRTLHRELRRAIYSDAGCMLIVTRLTDTKDTRTCSFTCGTGARFTDRRIVKAFNMEYLRLAKGEDDSLG